MKKIAIIGGSGFQKYEKQDVLFICRHGQNLIAPPKIDHEKNLRYLKEKGAENVIAICSVGSLKLNIKPGDLLIPDDYINITTSSTIYNEKAEFVTPKIDESSRTFLLKILEELKISVHKKGVYWQSGGTRLETKAEINFIKNFADVVGMTMASEATIAQELGLKYAAICTIDNYANGLVDKPLTIEEIFQTQKENKAKIELVLDEMFGV